MHDLLCQNKHKRLHKQNMQQSYDMKHIQCMPVTLTQQVWANQVSYTTWYTPIVCQSHWPNKLEPIRWHVLHDIHPLYASHTDPTSLSQSGDTYHMIYTHCMPVTLTQQVRANQVICTTWYTSNAYQLHWPNKFEPIR
jgi:hypothetical protein